MMVYGRFYAVQLVFQLCMLACAATAAPLQNITLPLPVGTSNHGTPGLLCTPTKWSDVILFYLFNYVAHAATVLTRPGERSDDFMVSVIGSLLFPVLGLYRGIEAILSRAVFVKNDDLRKAARSGALCLVVRGKDWRPVEGDKISNAIYRRAKREEGPMRDERSLHIITYSPPWLKSRFGTPVYVHRQIIHGTYKLPEGYRFAIVPPDTQFTVPASPNAVLEVSATYNMVKALIALVQSGYALSTLYQSRGDQIEQFGYAAFGLTVAPYAVMSIMNLIGNLCRPDYASLYLVENSVMEEARRRGGVFEGSVGRVCEESTTVYGCGLLDADNAEHLHFSANDSSNLTASFDVSTPSKLHKDHRASDQSLDRSVSSNLAASFDVTSPSELHKDHRASDQSLEKSVSVCSSMTVYSHAIKPLPPKLDYAGTGNDALLLIPCCNPVKRGSALPSAIDVPANPCLEKLNLAKSWAPFKHRDWIPVFSPSASDPHPLRWQIIVYLLTIVIALTPLAVYGAISRFQSGSIPSKESSTWKAYTMQWLIMGVWSGICWVMDQEGKNAKLSGVRQFGPVLRACSYVFSGSSAVGGFVVVGQMLVRYGVCVWVGD